MVSEHVLAVRRAVRVALAELDVNTPVLAACSGGPDSLALAAALSHVARRDGRVAGAVTVDHGLQAGSAERARATGAVLVRLGLEPVQVCHVRVVAGRHGPEGGARAARYSALDAAADRCGGAVVLLGHTREDQAETVLLGLSRGSGTRSLAGMAAAAGRYLRPLLTLPREVVRSAVPADVKAWEDPHNADPAYARARARHRVLPVLEAELGPGVAAALARTGELLRADADALDAWAERELTRCAVPPDAGSRAVEVRLAVVRLAELPLAVRSRVLRRAAIAAGSPPTDLTVAHVRAVDALVARWHGQRGVDLPGQVRAVRSGQVITLAGVGPSPAR